MIKSSLLTVMLGIALVSPAFGVVLLSDDFEADTVDAAPSEPPWAGIGVAGNFLVRDDTTASPFGANNKWLEAGSFASGGLENGRVNFPGADLVTVSFDAYFDTTAFSSRMRFAPRGNQSGSEANLTFFDWNGGEADLLSSNGDFALDTAEHYDLVFNITGSTVNYNSTSVAHNTFDVWKDGVLLRDDELLDLNETIPNTEISEIGFWQLGAGSESQTWLDNLVIQDTPFVMGAGTPGDFDGDGDVDGADFLGYQRDDASQIPTWQTNYPAPLSAVTAVPEPSSLLLAIGLTSLVALRRKQLV